MEHAEALEKKYMHILKICMHTLSTYTHAPKTCTHPLVTQIFDTYTHAPHKHAHAQSKHVHIQNVNAHAHIREGIQYLHAHTQHAPHTCSRCTRAHTASARSPSTHTRARSTHTCVHTCARTRSICTSMLSTHARTRSTFIRTQTTHLRTHSSAQAQEYGSALSLVCSFTRARSHATTCLLHHIMLLHYFCSLIQCRLFISVSVQTTHTGCCTWLGPCWPPPKSMPGSRLTPSSSQHQCRLRIRCPRRLGPVARGLQRGCLGRVSRFEASQCNIRDDECVFFSANG